MITIYMQFAITSLKMIKNLSKVLTNIIRLMGFQYFDSNRLFLAGIDTVSYSFDQRHRLVNLIFFRISPDIIFF